MPDVYIELENGHLLVDLGDQQKIIPNDGRNVEYRKASAAIADQTAQLVRFDRAGRDRKRTAEQRKEQLNAQLRRLTHTFADGREIQVRLGSNDETLIRGAIAYMAESGLSTMPWRMVDNSLADITADELAEALRAARHAIYQAYQAYNQGG